LALDGVLPSWLDRPDDEAISIALEVQRGAFGTLWTGELATFDGTFARVRAGRGKPQTKEVAS
jgi:hypothetical protein